MLYKLKYVLTRNRGFESFEINQQQLEKMVEKGAVLLDVRSPQEFEEGHLEKAILIPEYEMKNRAEKLLRDKSQIIIVYCSTGHRSQKAQKILQRLGYQQVYNLYNGLENYN